jgi:hypothetical protein
MALLMLNYKDTAKKMVEKKQLQEKIKNDQKVTKFYNSLGRDIWSVNSL